MAQSSHAVGDKSICTLGSSGTHHLDRELGEVNPTTAIVALTSTNARAHYQWIFCIGSIDTINLIRRLKAASL